MNLLSRISMQKVFDHYKMRFEIHKRLVALMQENRALEFAELALAISNKRANYSAYEHGLGNRILSKPGREDSVLGLAKELFACDKAGKVPVIIMARDIPYLKISVGSEISMLLRPNDLWVANVRTVWAYLLVKHAYNFALANEELELFRDGERSSEMNYDIWVELHRLLETTQVHLHDLAMKQAQDQAAPRGEMRFLWADAIANEVYERRDRLGTEFV